MEPESKMPDHDPTSADAEWKKIQQRTFTRWCNEHLKCANIVIYDLETDLCDGIKLIVLLEVLSQKRVGKYNKRPNFKSMKLENVAIALKFIEMENIKLVNIDAGDIVKGNLKLILGLIWTLILKYQISMPMGEYEYDDDDGKKGKGKDSGLTPKQALLAWVKSKMPPEIPMNNFTTDWNDGRAIAALVDAVEPGLYPDVDPEDLDPNEAVKNAETAMKTAEKYLGVPPVLDAADMCNPKVDELSVMTYISYFPEAKCKPGVPHRPNLPPAAKCHAEGPGIQPEGLVAKQPAPFKLIAQNVGKGEPQVSVVGPDRKNNVPCEIKDNGDKTYSCLYTPPTKGIYDVHIKWKGRHIPKSPFRVKVASDLDPSKCYAEGPGLSSGIVEHQWTNFTVYTKGAGAGKLHVDIIDPQHSKDIEIKIEEKEDAIYYVQYKPARYGKHTINLKFEGEHIPKSPYHVNVVSSRKEPVPAKVKAFGPGLEPKGIQATTTAVFTVDAVDGGDGDLKIVIKGPKGEIPCDIKDNGDGTYTCTYTAPVEGRYTINITWSGKMIPKSPYKIEISRFIDITKIKAYGPGLEKGYAGQPCKFTVETGGADVESLGFAVEGPHQAEIKCTDLGKGKCEVTYYPTKPGDYTVHVTCNNKDIPDSPFTVPIAPGGDANKCYAEGPGLEPKGNVAGTPAKFTVHTKDAGVGDVEVTVKDERGRSMEIEIVNNKDGTTSVVYHPDKPGKYTIVVMFNGKPIPKSPYKVEISRNNPAKCKAYGPGLEKSEVGKPAKFTIETIGAGEGGLGLTIEGPTETKIDCKDKGDGTCEVTYYPEEPGDHLINILYADQHIPNSPFTAKASYPVDASKVKISGPGLEPGVKAGLPADIDIDATKAGDAPLEVEVLNPQNKKVKVDIDEESPGMFNATYYPEKPGKHTVNVKYGGKHVPNSPQKIDVKPKGDASKCKPKGPGLESPVVNEPTSFDVDCKRAGEGELVPSIVSPTGEKVDAAVKDNKDGTYTVGYTPTEVGPHKVDVKYDGDSIPGTPTDVNVLPKTDSGKVKAYGPGLEGALTGQKAQFTVDTREAGPGGLSLAVEGPSEAKLVCKDNKDGTCSATYVPEVPGEYDVHVKYADEHVPGSPFKVTATRPVDASKVKCFGPGVDKEPIFEGVPTHFTVDATEAGDAPLDVTIETPDKKKIKPDSVTKNDDDTYDVKYTSPKQGRCAVDVKYGDKPVPNSPFRMRCGPPYDASKVKVTGPAVEKAGPVTEEITKAVVDTTEAGVADLTALLETPSGKKIEPTITPLEEGKYEIAYEPEEAGPHKLNVKYGNDHVKDSPFRVKVAPSGDAGKVKVSGNGLDKPRVGQLVDIIFDTTEAGKGHPKCTIKSPSGKDVPVEMIDNGDGTYTCKWTPTEEGVHTVDVMYGGEPVRGSPFKVKAVKPVDVDKIKANVMDEVETSPCVDQPLEFGVDPRDAEKDGPKGTLSASIVTPSGKTEYPDVRANPDGTYAVTYTPKEPGIYSLTIMYDEEPIPGSPFQFEVVEGGPERVIAFGKGLERGIVEETAEFTVITKDAGPGGLSLAVEGPSKAEIQCVDNGDGSCSVSYVPKEPGEYNVVVKFADKHIPGSPFAAEIFPKGTDLTDAPRRERPVVGKPCDVKLDIPDIDVEKDFKHLTGTLRRPGSDKEEPIELSKNPDGTLGVTFTPYEPGEHLISIKKRGKHVPNSPFSVMVQAPRLGDMFPSGRPADIDLSNIKGINPEDLDKLTATLRRPKSKVEESVKLLPYPNGDIGISFVPREPGEHFLTVKKDGHPIPGSPFSILVESEEPVNAVGAPVDACLDLPGVNLPDDFTKLKGTLKRPSSNTEEPLKLVLNSDNSLSISFVPKETGKHLVGVKKFNRHVNGSPIPVMVTAPEPVYRSGMPCGVELENVTPEDLLKLDAGLLRPGSQVEEPIRVKQNSDNSLSASFFPREEGLHKLNVRKDKKPVPESPYLIDVLSKDKVEEVYPIGRTCDVGLDIPGVNLPEDFDKLTATIRRPNSDKEEPLTLELYPDNTLGISFVPLEPGEHIISVKKSGEDVPGSPFVITVDAPEAVNAVGRPCDCQMDIPELKLPEDLPKLKATLRRPGSDEEEPITLKVLSDNTLSASFVPKTPGEHIISVTKNNRPVTGSPFSVMVTDTEPAHRVGQPAAIGLEDIPVEDLPRLEAGLQRPGSDVEEPIRIKQNSDDVLSASFVPHDEGVHKIHVRKDKKPLPQSPYLVNVLGKDVVEEVHPVGRTCDVGLDIPGVNLPDDFKKLTATLERPSSKTEEPVNLELNPDNTLGVTFVPTEPGQHWIRVKKSGKEVPESPFPIMVERGEPEDAVGSLCDVPLNSPDITNPREDLPKLTGTLRRPGSTEEEPITLKVLSDNTLSASFVPKTPGEHLITVKKRNRPVAGSPFSVMVTGEEPYNTVGRPATVPFDNVPAKDFPKLDSGIQKPGSEVEEPVTVKKASDDTLYASFIPQEEGPHKVNVRKDKKPVPDSPYICDVKPAKKPVEEVYPVKRPCDIAMDIPGVKLPEDLDKLTVTLQRPNSTKEEPLKPELNPDNTLGINFVPLEPGKHIIRVKKSGKEVPGSPFEVMVEPEEPEEAVGSLCDVPLNSPDITNPREDLPKLTGTLKRPGSTKEEPIKLKVLSDNTLNASFVPKSPGEHLITVKKRNRPVAGSPFSVMVTAEEPIHRIGKPTTVPLENVPSEDLPKLDSGVKRPGSNVEEPVTVKQASDDTLYASFIPHEKGPHNVNVRKDKKPVPDSPYIVDVPEDEGKPKRPVVEEVHPVGRTCDVGMDIPGVNLPEDFKKLTATLQRPNSKKEEPVTLELNPDNTLGISFVPVEPGRYIIRIKLSGKELPESPFEIIVEPGEPEDAVGSLCDVPLNSPDITNPREDLPKLTGTLKRPGSTREEPITLKVLSDNTLSASFVPKSPGEHIITVKKRNRPVAGSPFSIMVTLEEPKPKIGKPSTVPFENVPSKDYPKLDAGLKRPGSKVEEPVTVKKASDDTLYASFVPHEEGPHKVGVRKDKKPVPDSPYVVDVPADEGKPERPVVEEVHPVGRTCDVGMDIPGVNLPDDFKKLTATLQRPNSKKEEPVTLELNPDNTLGISFVPVEPGRYIIRIKLSGKELPESPFEIIVEPGEPEDAVGSLCDVPLNSPDITNPREDLPKLTGTLKRPGSTREEPITLKVLSDNTLSASFVPKSPGEHIITVKKRNRPVAGSPFSIMVTLEEPKQKIGKPSTVPFENVPSKDYPKLDAGLKRPGSKVEEPVTVKKASDDTLYASFVPHEEGPHKVEVRKDKKPVPDSPYVVDVPADEGKPKRPVVEEVYPVGRTCDVAMDIPGVNVPDDFKKLTATLQRPNSKKEEPVTLELNPDNTLGISFVPVEPGRYFIRVSISGKEVPELSFEITVEVTQPEYTVGSPCDTPIYIPGLKFPDDLSKLTATIKRPGSRREETIKLRVLSDRTLTASFLPKTTGDYIISIKMRNRPVTGSPFTVKVTGTEPKPTIGKPSSIPFEDLPAKDRPKLDAVLQRPGSDIEEPVTIKQTSDDTLYASFIPHEKGPHKLNIRKDKKPLPDSSKVIDVPAEGTKPERPGEEQPKRPTVEEVYPVGRPCKIGLDVPEVTQPDDLKKVKTTLQRPNSKKEEPLNPELNPDNTLGVSFVPKEPGDYSIKVTGKGVPEKTFDVKVEDTQPENTMGSPCDTPLDISGLNLPDDLPKLTTTIKRPGSTKEEPITPKLLSDNTLSASFLPQTPGDHLITVKKNRRNMPGSPVPVKVTDTEPQPSIGKPSNVPFEKLPAKDLPKLDATLQRPGSDIEEPVIIQKTSDDTLFASFIPHEEGPHKINVRKDKKPLPDASKVIDVPAEGTKPERPKEDKPKRPGEKPKRPGEEKKPVEEVYPVGRPCNVGMDVPEVKTPQDVKKLTTTLKRPNSKKEEPLTAELNPDKTLGVSFVPKEPGDYSIKVTGKDVPEKTFDVKVEDTQPENTMGSPCDTPLDIAGLNLPDDLPKLTTTIKRPGSTKEEPITPKLLSDNTLSASFLPQTPGDHLITVKKNRRNMPGSPVPVKVTDTEPQPSIGKPSNVPFEKLPAKDLPKLDATVQRPGSDIEEPVIIQKTSDDTLFASFIPHEEGPHKINVRKDKKPLPDASKVIDVPAEETKPERPEEGKPKRPGEEKPRRPGEKPKRPGEVTPKRPEEKAKRPEEKPKRPDEEEKPVEEVYPVGRPCNVGMDVPEVKTAEDVKKLKTTLKRPNSKKEEPLSPELNPDNTLGVSFVPKEPGDYSIKVTGKDIPETILDVKVEDTQPENTLGSPCDTPLDIAGLNLPNDLPRLTATIKRPGSTKEEPITPKLLSDNTLSASFLPQTPGDHLITVKKNRRNMPGSPVPVKVTDTEPQPSIGKPSNVPFEKLPAKDLPKLDATVQRPGSDIEEPVIIQKTSDDTLFASFIPHEEGPHKINVRKDKKPLPDASKVIDVPAEETKPERPEEGKPKRPGEEKPRRPGEKPKRPGEVTPKRPEEKAKRPEEKPKRPDEEEKPVEEVYPVGRPCNVGMDVPEVKTAEDVKKLKTTLKRPNSKKEEPLSPELNPDNTLGVSFVPKEPGDYSIKVTGKDIPETILDVKVEDTQPENTLGSPCDTPLDIAGLNLPNDLPRLTATIKRPGSTKEEPITPKLLSDNTLSASFLPQTPGDHLITVKKNRRNMPGSPVPVKVTDTEPQPSIGKPSNVPFEKLPAKDLPKLDATVQRPGSDIEEPVIIQKTSDDTLFASFIPHEEGPHKINVRKDKKPLPDASKVIDVPAEETKPGRPEEGKPKRPGQEKPKRPDEEKPKPPGEEKPKPPGEEKPKRPWEKPKPPGEEKPKRPWEKPKPPGEEKPKRPWEKPKPPGEEKPKRPWETPKPPGEEKPKRPWEKPKPPGEEKPKRPGEEKPKRPGEEKPKHRDEETMPVEEVYPVGRPCHVGMDVPEIKTPEDVKKLKTTLKRPKSNKEEPLTPELNPDNTLGVSFVPKEPGDYSIKVTGKDVPEKTFDVKVEDTQPENTMGSPCDTPLDIAGLNLPDDLPKLTTTIKRPGSTKEEPITPKLLSDNTLSASFLPQTPGDHLITVKKNRRNMPGSPVPVKVTDTEPQPSIGTPSNVPFESLPAKDLPKLDATVQRPGSDIEEPVIIQKTSDGTLFASFIPHEEGPHKINVQKDKKPLPDASKVIDVPAEETKPERPEEGKPKRPGEEKPKRPEEKPKRPEEKAKRPEEKAKRPEEKPKRPEEKAKRPEEKPKRPDEEEVPVEEVYPVGRPCNVGMDVPEVKTPEDVKKLKTTLKRPNSKKEEPLTPKLNPDNTLGISFVPKLPGDYSIKVTGKDVPEKTFDIKVEGTQPENTMGSPCDTPLDIAELNLPNDLSRLTATIKRPGSTKEEPITPKLLSDNTLSASFLPQTPGDHLITVKKGRRIMPGSPVPVKVTDTEPQPSIGKPSNVPFEKLPAKDLPKLDATVQRPGSDIEEPVIIQKTSDGTLFASFIPHEEGPHKINVQKDKKPLPDASKVIDVPAEETKPERPDEGKPKRPGEEKPKRPGEEKPKRPEEKPKRPEEKPKRPEEKPKRPEEKPKRPEEKPKRPEEKAKRPEEKPKRPEEKPKRPEEKPKRPDEEEVPVEEVYPVGRPCNVGMDVPEVKTPEDVKKLKTTLKRPNSKKEEPLTPELNPDNTLGVSFVPKEPGDYSIKVTGKDVPEKTFDVKVEDTQPENTMGSPCDTPLDIAGLNLPDDLSRLTATIKRPGSTKEEPITPKLLSDNTLSASFLPQTPGDHLITVKKNRRNMPGSPVPVKVTDTEPQPSIGKPSNVPFEKLPAKDLPKLDATVQRPGSDVLEPVIIQKASDDTLFASFIPHEEGPHKVSVRKDKKPLPDASKVIDVPTEEIKPERPEEGKPKRPGDEKPRRPGEEKPKRPGEEKPKRPGEEKPKRPGEEKPKRPGEEKPERPGEEKPERPGEEKPERPGEEKPGRPGDEKPKRPGEEKPKRPGEEKPERPGEEKPKRPGEEKPERPGEEKPKRPDEEKPEEHPVVEEVYPVGRPCDVGVDVPEANLPEDFKSLKATLQRPNSKQEEPVDLSLNPDDTLGVSFLPKEPGDYSIKITGRNVPERTFDVKVEDTQPEKTVGSPCDTPLDIPGLPDDLSRLRVTINRPGSTKEEPITPKLLSDNTLSVSFLPQTPGDYTITVRNRRRSIPGGTISVNVTDTESRPGIGKPSSVTFENIPSRDLPKLDATLQRPGSDVEETVTIKQTADETLYASFIPHDEGPHKITVRKNKKPLPDASKVIVVPTVETKPKRRVVEEVYPVGRTCEVEMDIPGVDLTVDFKRLTATIQRPNSKKEEPVTLELNPNNTLGVTFLPEEPGRYVIRITIIGSDFPEFSFEILVEDYQPQNTVGSPCETPLNIPGLDLPDDLSKLTSTLKRPDSTKEEPIILKVLPDNTLSASFVPHSPGEHLITIKRRYRNLPGSPFSIMVTGEEPKKRKPVLEVITVEDRPSLEAGQPEAPLVKEVHPVGRTCDIGIDIPGINLPGDFVKLTATLQRPNSKDEEPVNLELNPDFTLGISFVPAEPGRYLIRVMLDGKKLPGVFEIIVEEIETEHTVGGPCDTPLHIPGLNLPDDLPKLTGTLKRPGVAEEEPIKLKLLSDNTLSVSFVAKAPGEHFISIKKDNRHVPGSPLSVMVAASKPRKDIGKPVKVHLENVSVRDLPKLEASLQRPGSDDEEILVIKPASDDTLYVTFIPRDQGPHKIIVRKNKKPVPGSPFVIDVTGKDVFSTTPVQQIHPAGRPCDMTISFKGINLPGDFEQLTATLQRPNSNKEEPVSLLLNPDNTLGISFVPMEPGEHLVRVKKSGEDVPGSPFSIMVEAAEAVNAVGRPCDCHLDIPGLNLPADLTKIKATLKRPDSDTEEPVKLKVLSDNTLSVSFVPRSPGEHLISVKKFNRHLSGSPFSVMVTAPETASQSVGRPCGLGLEIPGLKLPEDFDLLTAVLKRPGSTTEEPLKLVLNSDNTLSVSFIPKETGEHLISVFKNKRHVTGSPFSVTVSGPGPADASKVKAYGDGLEFGVVDEKAKFTVNTRDAGYGGLGLSIEGPSKAEINCVDNEDGTCTVDYVPKEPGDYTIHVRFADEEIPGSPFTCNVVPVGGKRPPRRPVVEEGISRQTESDVSSAPAQRTSQLLDDLVSFSPQQPHDFAVDLGDYDVKNLKASVETPSGRTEPAEIVETSPGTYTIRFVTKEGGVYKVSVKNRGRHIPGSPFEVQVDAPQWGGAQKCIAAGPGLERGVVNKPADFTVWTRDAGPGGLAVAIEGPAKTEIDCKDNGDGSCSISYVPTEPGEYTVHVRFADENIPSAPFKVFVTAEEDERFRDLSVSDMAETGISVGQPASFSVQTNGPVGEVTASVLAPSGTEGPATVSDRGNGSYAIRFVPREVGDHLISVRFDGIHIPGSPFKVRVGGGHSDPGKVRASGPGLQGGVAGKETYFTVDALQAGTGALALSIDGPAKVRMNCTENPDGTYRVTYLPMVSGEYKITIKFADQNIPRSPYNVTITGDGSSGNAEKCKPVGSGLHRAVIGEPNAFTVNCSDAGRGSLMVGVEGPAIPAKEIKIKHTGGKVYAVNYTLEEPGEYILKVLWGEKHIPGSPFHVTV